jgi:large subunit ribosomal protein L6
MRKDLTERVVLGEGIDAEIKEEEITLKKAGKSIGRKFSGFLVRKEGNEILLECKKATKREKKMMKTLKAHLINAVKGLGEKFVYKLQVCIIHFPMTVTLDKAKNEVVIKNFLGEVKPRIAKIVAGSEVKIEKDSITVTGENKENAGQTAANIEKATRITNRDRRTYQDGIYIIEKPGEKIF